MTINIWKGGQIFDKLVDFIKKENADIIAMQEVWNSNHQSVDKNYRSLTELKRELFFYEYVNYAPSYLIVKKFGDIEAGNAVFSKYKILDQKAIFYDIPFGKFDEENNFQFDLIPRNLQKTTISLEGTFLNLFNTQGIWGQNGRDNDRRIGMSEKIVSEVKDKKNVILAGDFNVNPDTRAIKNIEKYLINLFKDELETTFNIKRKTDSGFTNAVVDMVFVSQNIKILKHYCPNVDVSDHLPLVAILEI